MERRINEEKTPKLQLFYGTLISVIYKEQESLHIRRCPHSAQIFICTLMRPWIRPSGSYDGVRGDCQGRVEINVLPMSEQSWPKVHPGS